MIFYKNDIIQLTKELKKYDDYQIILSNTDQNSPQTIILFGGNEVQDLGSTNTNEISATITIGDGSDLHYGVGFNPVNDFIYISNDNTNDNLAKIDENNNVTIVSISELKRPRHFAFNTKNNLLYITNSNTVVSIDSNDNFVSKIDFASSFLIDILYNSTSDRIYVCNFDNSRIEVLEIDNNNNITVEATITGISGPQGLALNTLRNIIYATQFSNNVVSVIDPVTNTIIKNITLDVGAGLIKTKGIAYNTANNQIYVLSVDKNNIEGGKITIINADTDEIISSIDNENLLTDSGFIGYNEKNSSIIVPNVGANTIMVINKNDVVETNSLDVGVTTRSAGYSPKTGNMYLTGTSGDKVIIIESSSKILVTNGNGTPLTEVVEDVKFNPIIIKHVRIINDDNSCSCTGHIKIKRKWTTGKICTKHKGIDSEKNVYMFQSIFDIRDFENLIIDGQTSFEVTLEKGVDITMLMFYKQYFRNEILQ